ncbi:ribosome small subunit-dependent GTPase A [Pelolinea submarina]|uniref:Small ribosomal subunit biogenesis GTPase RsgA n=1 Tax=Pelolinea submarina TaxID=913107 RepID=A0A347ZPV7_9CHLR|nr:ribosome small subunit-dependent GTPase A [Pelolinea submarina]REG04647.1 ribosome biogenesis GTPase [Pelolinea submarina]BBB47338.1 ribosome biogenesis GTPase /thiamine phosphate phosphatase [Pelolinea submarina]
MNASPSKGLVVRQQAGFYTVDVGGKEITCKLRGKFKQLRANEDLVAIGDWVLFSLLSDESGVIEEILPRQNAFFRLAPSARGDYKQILIANIDQIFFVFSCAEPEPSMRMLDRFLVIAEKQKIPPVIVANKVDLIGEEQAHRLFSVYEDLGYPLLLTSAHEKINIDPLREYLIGRTSAFSGPSGVGKSSLLNRVQPDLGAQIGRLKASSGKGRHTTVVRQLIPLKDGGYVADMPGLRSLSLWDTEPEELDGYFPEMRDLVADCQYNNCSHIMEPGCAIKEAVQKGKIDPARYDSYIRLRQGDDL